MNLKSVEIFKELADNVLDNITKILDEKKVEKDTVIFEEGEPADVFCLIAEGQVEIFKRISNTETKTLAIFSVGDYFGEMSLFEDKPRIASVKAIDDVTLLVIKREKFWELIQSDLDTGMRLLSAIMSTILSRLSTTNSHLMLLYDAGKIIASSKNLNQMATNIFLNLKKHFRKSDSGLIAVYNEFTNELDVHSSFNDGQNRDTISLSDVFVQKIIGQKEIIETAEKSVIASAFYFEDKFLGFVVLKSNQKNAFSVNDLILLSSVASLVSVSIKNISFIAEEEARRRLNETKSRQGF
ncbi:MAG: cyclic nucleotide-binding domain-containing protein [Elusimicrobiota bacterium]